MHLIDTHCHLNFKAFKDSYLDVAKRAKDAGVEKIIIPGSNIENSVSAIEMAKMLNNQLPPTRWKLVGDRCHSELVEESHKQDPESRINFAYPAVGIHPVHVDELARFSEIEKLAAQAIAIGECGLDFFHDQEKSTLNQQKDLFIKHLKLALAKDLPLICHNRQADKEILEILAGCPKLPKMVFHCFSSNWNFAKTILEKGASLSFTGNITYGNKSLKKVIERTPLERIMVETDAPYIVPEPLRSQGEKRNEPAYVVEVTKKIAQIKNLSLSEVASATTHNAVVFFKI